VVDWTIETIRPGDGRRATWVDRRDWALDQWSGGALEFVVERRTPSVRCAPATWDSLSAELIAGAINVVRECPDTGWTSHGGWATVRGLGIVWMDLEPFFFRPSNDNQARHITTHEVGHALGFGHGGGGVMATSTPYVSTEEMAAVQYYYG
jgi:hypothetical protein